MGNTYETPIGGNDVPYSIAYGEENIYFFDDASVKILSKELFSSMDVDYLWNMFFGNRFDRSPKGLNRSSKKSENKNDS